MTEPNAQMCIELAAARTAKRIAERENIDPTDALRGFMFTKTFELLADAESRLCLESVEYILDMLDAEKQGDAARWLRI